MIAAIIVFFMVRTWPTAIAGLVYKFLASQLERGRATGETTVNL